ncbi:MAG: tetratricopeptide repeat protein [Flavobacteriia bacterium]|nr:tetratricopeptide repeat protein [Flavobacteriia bacterium]
MRTRFFFIAIIGVVFLGMLSSTSYSQSNEEQKLLSALKREKNESKKFQRLVVLGDFYKNHNIYLADSISHVILQKSRNLGNLQQFKALLFTIQIEEIEGDQESFFKDILALEPFLYKLSSKEVKFEIYKYLGCYYSSTLKFEKANIYLKEALMIAKKARNNTNISETYSKIAYNFMLVNNKDSAFYFTDHSIQYARRSANKSVIAESFNTQARIYDFFGQVELSVAKNLIANNLAIDAYDLPKMARISRELGMSQRTISNLDDAEFFFKKSYEYAQMIHDKRQMALALINLGTVYRERKLYDKAIDVNLKGIELITKLKDNNGLAEAHNNLGMVYSDFKKYDLASSNFNQALIYYESTGNREKIAGVYHNVGTVFYIKKKYNIALNYLNRSIEIRQQFGSKSQMYPTYRIISDVYEKIGNAKQSLWYLQKYLNYIDNNTSLQASTKIAELSELYRSEQRERLISMQADSIERQRQEREITSTKLENTELRNSFQTYIIIGFIIIIILAGVIIISRQNQNKIRQQQKEAEMSQALLRTQMNPHFIFNAMSVIQSYIYENDIKNSTKFLVNFSRLIRLILENSPKEFIPITTEMEILQKYLETQKLRFEERFEFDIEMDQTMMIEHAMIPPMITQPFIENAIEHGQLHTVESGFIKIIFSKDKEMLHIEIIDNGIGRSNSEKNKKRKDHTSMALGITKERINNLNMKYKTDGYLQIEDYDNILHTGTKILISLPYHVDTNPNKN